MCKFIGKFSGRILCKLSKNEILRLYSMVHVAMETMRTSHFTCQSKSFISIFFTCQVSACELQPFSCHYLANEIYSQTAKTVFSHLTQITQQYPHHNRQQSVRTQLAPKKNMITLNMKSNLPRPDQHSGSLNN